MAKSQTRLVEPADNGGNSADAERMADLNEAEGGELFRAIEEARSTQGAEVILTRTMPADKAGFCDKIPVAEFDLALLKSKYGPGTYRIRFNGPTGFLPGGSTIKIAPSPERAAASAPNDMTSFMEMMDRRESERRARTDDWFKLAVTGLAPVLAAWVSRPASGGPDIAGLVTALKPAPGPGLAELTTALTNMKNLTAPPQQESKVDEILKIFETVQGLTGDKDDAKGSGSSWIDIVRDLIKAAPDALKPVLEARMRAMQGGQPNPAVSASVQPVPGAAAVRSIPQPAPAAADANFVGSAASNGGDDMIRLFMPVIKENLAKVVGWAEKDRDPQIYADVLVDELPDNFGAYMPLPKVMDYLNHPQWFEEICKIEPRLQPHREWCNDCRLTIVEIMKTMGEPEETPPNAMSDDNPGNAVDVVNTAEN